MKTYREVARDLPVRELDVVVAGGSAAGVVAAARQIATVELRAVLQAAGVHLENGSRIRSRSREERIRMP